MNQQAKVERALEVIDEIIGDVEPFKILNTPELYSEVLLQDAEHGYKYYEAYQRHTRQFIATGSDTIVRWRNSNIEQIQASIIESSFLGGKKAELKGDSGSRSYSRPTSNALFSWSSDEAYIQSRKRELLKKQRLSTLLLRGETTDNLPAIKSKEKDVIADNEEDQETEEQTLVEKYNLKLAPEVMSKLNQKIDTESNSFIHERIQTIKQHHSEEISKQINERKRKDHELHLQRLKMKEEQFERELRAATEEKEKDKGNKFLLLFTFNNTDTSSKASSEHTNESDSKGKRFSFLPKTALFSSKDSSSLSKSSPKVSDGELTMDSNAVVEVKEDHIETASDVASKDNNTAKTDNLKTPAPSESAQKPTEHHSNKSITIESSDIDLIFNKDFNNGSKQLLPVDEFDDFQEFEVALPSKEKKVDDFEDFKVALPSKENKVAGHTFMPMSEPKPLIDFD